MSSRLTMILAVALFFAAIAAGYWGLVISRPAEVPAQEQLNQASTDLQSELLANIEKNEALAGLLGDTVEDVQRTPVVVLAREVKAMAKIQEDDLVEEMLRIAPPGSYTSAAPLVGSVVWRDLAAGTVLNEASFAMGGPLGRMIKPNERAFAIDVDEVTSAGGHLQPGDYVDVLLFLRDDERNSDRTAQVVVPALRVLSMGPTLGASTQGEPQTLPEVVDDENAPRSRNAQVARTVVLAIPESLITRFMLATQVGTLRLAVRSVDEKLLAAYQAGEESSVEIEEIKRQLFQFEKLAIKEAKRPQPGLVAPRPRPVSIPVYSGASITRQNP
ncbi:MAG: Flp pilus assembly protein CpaB [Gammaproteobacteria bacterium]|nr:Flp pilus assembly protein CpaB [Gammaproteobacteria bacterium]